MGLLIRMGEWLFTGTRSCNYGWNFELLKLFCSSFFLSFFSSPFNRDIVELRNVPFLKLVTLIELRGQLVNFINRIIYYIYTFIVLIQRLLTFQKPLLVPLQA